MFTKIKNQKPKQDNMQDCKEKIVPTLCSQRWILAYVGFFGFCVVYSLRVNMNVAIVCMVKQKNTSRNHSDAILADKGCVEEAEATSYIHYEAEFDWDSSTKSTILASFYYGYMITQIPGGWLADKYGGKRVLGSAVFISAVLTILTPLCARTNLYLAYTVRILLGVLTGVAFPAMHSMWGKWAPSHERSSLTALCYSGTTIGSTITFLISGLLCAHGFDNGWGSIFYLTGSLGLLWSALWYFSTSDSPVTHPRITDAEMNYVVENTEANSAKQALNVPWLTILTSPCVWACVVAHVCNNWTNITLLTNTPTYMNAVLKFGIKQSGALIATQYIFKFVAALFAGHCADFLRSRKILSTTATRKLMQTICFIGTAMSLVSSGFWSCHHRYIAVSLMCVAGMFTGFERAGFFVNQIDFAPKYAGVICGITNTIAAVSGMVAPVVTGILTPNNTQSEWRNVFYICAGVNLTGTIVFGLFASGDVQYWAKNTDDDKTVIMPEPEKIVTNFDSLQNIEEYLRKNVRVGSVCSLEWNKKHLDGILTELDGEKYTFSQNSTNSGDDDVSMNSHEGSIFELSNSKTQGILTDCCNLHEINISVAV